MPHALWTLLRLNFRGTFRRMLRGTRTARGIVFLMLGILAFCAWLGPQLYRATRMPRADPQYVRTIAPFAILAFCLGNLFASFGEKAVAFTGAEVDFLFPGPFTRRSLLGYKILKTALGTFFTSLIFSIILLRYSSGWLACFVGVWLTIQFMQLFAMSAVMIGQTVGEQLYSRGRRIFSVGIIALLIITAGPKLTGHLHESPMNLMRQVHSTTAGRVLLAPLDVFAWTITARRSSNDPAIWGSVGLLIDLLMLAIVIGLDANYMETAAVVSQRRYERLQRIRSGGSGAFRSSRERPTAGFRVPQLPWLGGAGPIAWRQMTTAVRSSRSLFIVLGIIGLISATILMQSRGNAHASFSSLLGTVAWMNVVFISMLRFDFRDELDRLDLLRSLPIRPAAVALAEVITPVLVLSAMQAMLLIALRFLFHASLPVIFTAAAFAVPFNLLLTGVENLLFLMFPVRAAGLIAGDMQLFGRW